ncbi:papilin-like [Saccostrea echinata]|uniref:papilin-like n=1 Tax=Saccostrea echinata TaxID=191078 RepID=UPI002A81CCF0|nr:papilin-like [Saccostrea echinata]
MSCTQCLSTYTFQACYGNGFEDYMKPSCPQGQKIYVYDVYTYSKRKDRNCPAISYATNRNITYCCNYVNETEDCGKRYYGTAVPYEHEHYSRCSGRQNCLQGVQVSWNYTSDVCDSNIFMERSNYMKMWYNCLPDSDVISISNASQTAQSIFLSSAGYPLEMSPCGTTSGATCKVTASRDSTIRITGFDLQFSENSGVCKQRLFITDGASTTDVACDDVNNFARTTLYTSNSSSIDIRLDNTDTSTAGKFWIQVEATNSSEQVTVICQNSTPAVSCNDTFTILNPAISTNETTSFSLSTSAIDITTSVSSTTYQSLTGVMSSTEALTAISATVPVTSSLKTTTNLTSSGKSTSYTVTEKSTIRTPSSSAETTTDFALTKTSSIFNFTSSISVTYTTTDASRGPSGVSNQTTSGVSYQTTLGVSNQTPSVVSNQTSSGVSNQTALGVSNQTPSEVSYQTAPGASNQTPSGVSYQATSGVSNQTPSGVSNQTPLSYINGTLVATTSQPKIKNNENKGQSSGDSALLPALGAMLASIAMAGLMFYLYWKYKKKKTHQVLDDTIDPALQSHLPVISSLPPAREVTMAWDDKGSNSNKGHSSSKYEKEPTLISLMIHE